MSGWTLRWSFIRGQMVTNMCNATSRQSGAEVSATDVPKSATIPAGGTQVVGFPGNNRFDNPDPTVFSLNDHSCPVRR
ncbi:MULTISPECIES: cellulose binding domain-containing protein [Streptomyces]|nr:cellulose binding domain-containing protein [Streptomyces ureilyticus]WSZ64281.1 cellulose-binding domain-containing protein [Streptomyces canus]